MSNADIATKCAEAVANGNYTIIKYLQEPMTAAFDNLGTSLQKSDLARAVADLAAPSAALADRYAPTILQVIEQHAKTICKTFVISIFDLQQLKTEDGQHRFPYLSLAWSRHIKNCRCYNLKKRFVAKITPKAEPAQMTVPDLPEQSIRQSEKAASGRLSRRLARELNVEDKEDAEDIQEVSSKDVWNTDGWGNP